ncbi:hypothetical protein ACEWY4_024567 [Coilia grayii]|uniref:Reverse transcriptase RNase H-like domain-containing protein n=1 Tax=Coilia grayii TaxID=363190 RepID=A0ABD1J0T3_9TELE
MEEHDMSFEKLLGMVTEAPILKYYDASKPIKLSVDSSSCGIGAVRIKGLHRHAKKVRTNRKRIGVIIELVFGCDKFYQYLFGRTFEVEADHKPLEVIMKKPLAETPLRLQKMLLRLQKYNMTVKYKKGKELYVADALSRNFLKETDENENSDDVQLCAVMCLPIAPERLQEISTETEKDPTLTTLKQNILHGWANKKHTPDEIKFYWDYRSEMTIEDGLIFKGNKLVIPNTLRRMMLKKVHASHQGIEKSTSYSGQACKHK